MRLTHVLTLLATVLLVACGEDEEGIFCPGVYVPAARVTVVDSRGVVVDDARVTFTLDGGPEQAASCSEQGQVAGRCLAWETPNEIGTYVLRATSAAGQRSVQDEISSEGGECGPRETVEVQLVLPD